MADLVSRSQSSAVTATIVGILAGLFAISLYVIAGVLVAGWSVSEFLVHLSVDTVGYVLGMIVLTVGFVGLPVAAYVRFDLIAPLVIFVLVVTAWLILGALRGILSAQTIFGLALYATYYSPVAVLLYAIVGAGEYRFRDGYGN